MSDPNITGDGLSDTSADAQSESDAFEYAWRSPRNEVPDVSRSDFVAGPDCFDEGLDPYLLAWVTDETGERYSSGLPPELFDGTYRHVLVPPDPAYLYVHNDPAGREDRKVFHCMKSGLALLYPGRTRGVFYPTPCWSFAHEGCGPRRCRSIYQTMAALWESAETIYMVRIDAPHLDQLRARIGRMNTARGKAAKRAGKDGAKAITLITGVHGDFHAFIFSTVDFSARAWGQHAASTCDVMTLAHGLAYVDQLLRGGIIKRSTSRAFKLTDRPARRAGAGDAISLGSLTKREWNLLDGVMRDNYRTEDDDREFDDACKTWTREEVKRRGMEALAEIKAYVYSTSPEEGDDDG